MRKIKRYKTFNEDSRLNNLHKMREDSNKERELKSMKEYVRKTYTEEWFDEQLADNASNYIDEEEAEEYDGSYEEAYKNYCTGGAIEYDLLDDMDKELQEKFPNLTYNEISDFTNDHMIDVCNWYDRQVFSKSDEPYRSTSDKFFGTNDIMGHLDDI